MGEKQTKEQLFKGYLRGGEQVRWHGTTKPFPLLERDARFLILGKWIGSAAVSAVILGLYVSNNPDWSWNVVGLVLLVVALLKQMRPAPPTADADMGMTTIGGEQAGVVTRGEVRSLPVYGPGGYIWLPENGAAVLVIKGGPGGEEQCVSGTRQREAPGGMKPGEIYLYGPGENSVYLKADGTVDIRGRLMINGEPYKPCTCGEEAV